MNKTLLYVGGILGIVGIFLPYIDMSMAWWVLTIDPSIGSTTRYFLMPFGGIYNSGNSDIINTEGSPLVIIALIIIVGSILILIAGSKKNKELAIGGIAVLIGGLLYFLISVGNIEEVQGLFFIVGKPSNYLWGSDSFSFFVTLKYTWGIGFGFFVSMAGAVAGALALSKRY